MNLHPSPDGGLVESWSTAQVIEPSAPAAGFGVWQPSHLVSRVIPASELRVALRSPSPSHSVVSMP